MLLAKPETVLLKDCVTVTRGEFARPLKLTGRGGVDGPGGKNGSNARFRAVGAGCSAILMGDSETGGWIIAETYLAPKAPCRQTAPRAEIWAVLLILQAWGGAYDSWIVTDATYTVSGMLIDNRHKHRRGKNRNIWRLLYDEVDSKLGAGIRTVAKVQSHIKGGQVYHRGAPRWQIGLKDLAYFAADIHRDHHGGCVYATRNMKATEHLLLRVCKRIAVIEASLRDHSTDPPLVVADIIRSCEAEGERRRHEVFDIAEALVKQQDSMWGHLTSFRPHVDPKPCCKRLTILQHGGEPNEDCMRRGIDSGIWKCSKCPKQPRGRGGTFWKKDCTEQNFLFIQPDTGGVASTIDCRTTTPRPPILNVSSFQEVSSITTPDTYNLLAATTSTYPSLMPIMTT